LELNKKIRCLLISDLHFEAIEDHSNRNEIIVKFCKELTLFCKKECLFTLFIAGDITNDLENLRLFFQNLPTLTVKTFFVPGNHDIHINLHPYKEDMREIFQIIDVAFNSQEELPMGKKIWEFDSYSKYFQIKHIAEENSVIFLHDHHYKLYSKENNSNSEKWAIIGNMGWYDYDLFQVKGKAIDFYTEYYNVFESKYEYLFYKPPQNSYQEEFQNKISKNGIYAPILEPHKIFHDLFLTLLKFQIEQIKMLGISKVIFLSHFIPLIDKIPLKYYQDGYEVIFDQLNSNKYRLYYAGVEKLIQEAKFKKVLYLCGHTHFRRWELSSNFLQNPKEIKKFNQQLLSTELEQYFLDGIFEL